MARLHEIEMPDGTVIWARMDTESPDDLDGVAGVDVGLGDLLARGRVGNFTETIRSVAASVHQGISGLGINTVSVEFSIELSVKSGQIISILAEAGAKASVTVHLGWERTETSGSAPPSAAGVGSVGPDTLGGPAAVGPGTAAGPGNPEGQAASG